MKKRVKLGLDKGTFLLLWVGLLSFNAVFAESRDDEEKQVTLANFANDGRQITRFDLLGAAIDAHDGEIALFDGVYYLYGTSYDCGYEWGNSETPFCGFKVYSSRDLVHWTDEGFLFDAKTEIWQTRCNGGTYGCYRPHVLYNKKNNQYVLWINVYDNRVGYRVFTSSSPLGPFTETEEPVLAVNSEAPVAGLNNGDHDLFVDDDDGAYIAFTDWRTGGTIVIEELNDSYTSGTGNHVKSVTAGSTEAPSLMKRNDIYYVLYSDPNCGYCTTGTSYKTAPSPLGPWTGGTKININSCGGQPAFVSVFNLQNDTVFLYGSDLWNNGAKNEALANYFWAPLKFAPNGSIYPIECSNENLPVTEEIVVREDPESLDCSSGIDGFTSYGDITDRFNRGQAFVVTRTGILTGVSFATFRSGYPEAGFTIAIYEASEDYLPVGDALSSIVVPTESMGWAPKFVTVNPNIPVEAGKRYTMIVKTTAGGGSYGMQYNDEAPYPGGGAIYSSDGSASFRAESNRTLMFQTFVQSETAIEVNENTGKMNVNTYPNPVKQYLNVSLNGINTCSKVKIFDNMGNEVLSQQIKNIHNQDITMDVSSLSTGLYLVKLEDGTILKTVKILKQ
jgi:hypothetical protein